MLGRTVSRVSRVSEAILEVSRLLCNVAAYPDSKVSGHHAALSNLQLEQRSGPFARNWGVSAQVDVIPHANGG